MAGWSIFLQHNALAKSKLAHRNFTAVLNHLCDQLTGVGLRRNVSKHRFARAAEADQFGSLCAIHMATYNFRRCNAGFHDKQVWTMVRRRAPPWAGVAGVENATTSVVKVEGKALP